MMLSASLAENDRLVEHVRVRGADEETHNVVLREAAIFNGTKAGRARKVCQSAHGSTDPRDQLVLISVCQNALPYSITNSPAFKELIGSLDRSYRLPSPYALAHRLSTRTTKGSLVSVCDCINLNEDFAIPLEFGAWTSQTGLSVLGIILTSENGDSCTAITADPYTAEFLAECAMTSLKSSLIKSLKLNAITTDEASNLKRSRRPICEKKFSHLIEYRCIAHLCDLIGASISKHATTFVGRDCPPHQYYQPHEGSGKGDRR